MFKSSRLSILTAALILAMLFSAFPLGAVMAEGEEPAPPETPVTEEVPAAQEEAPPTQEEAPLTVEEVAALAPEGVAVVPVDPAGEVLPMVEEATVNSYVTGDPVLCPEGASWGDPACVHYATIDEAIDAAYGFDFSTIFVEADYTDLTPEPIFIDGDYFDNWEYRSLTLIGGVDISTGEVVGKTTLNRRMVVNNMRFFNMQNFIMNDVVEPLPDFSEVGATPEAAFTFTSDHSSDMSIINSEFTNNAGAGLMIQTSGAVSLDGVKANNNGAGNTVSSQAFGVYVYQSQFNNNQGTGLVVDSTYHIFMVCNQAKNNAGVDTLFPEIGGGGMYLRANGDISVWCSKVTGNSSYGLVAETSNTIYTASNNISGNGLIDFVSLSENDVVEQTAPCSEFCPSCSGGGSTGEEEKPVEGNTQVVIVKVGDGNGSTEIKPGYSTVFKLYEQQEEENKRLVQLTALTSGSAPSGSSAVYTPLDEDTLPAPLPEGASLIPWGFNLAITKPDGTAVESLIGYMLVRFYLPEGFVLPGGMRLVIQYYDPATSSWTPMSTAVGVGRLTPSRANPAPTC